MIVYIAGKITGDENYKSKFEKAQKKLEKRGFIVLSPAVLPEGMKKEKYMPICLAMIEAADMVILLNDWNRSQGAIVEHNFAIYQNKAVEYLSNI